MVKMKKRFGLLTAFILILLLALSSVTLTANNTANPNMRLPVASGTRVQKNARAEIDFSNAADGYFMARWLGGGTGDIRVMIVGPDNVTQNYRLNTDGRWETFVLNAGDGKYTLRVVEGVAGGKFAAIVSVVNTDVKVRDEKTPFLFPNQFVHFTADSKTVAKAAELTKDAKTVLEKVSAVYEFVISHMTYDHELARRVQSGYVPDLDRALEQAKGICFDYAALMTGMLRSQGIPTRLVFGYVDGVPGSKEPVYHAWISVFVEGRGWITDIIQFDGAVWNLMDPTFASTGGNNAVEFVGTGQNHLPARVH
jgi:transglutaminase-like putative cysteine protease